MKEGVHPSAFAPVPSHFSTFADPFVLLPQITPGSSPPSVHHTHGAMAVGGVCGGFCGEARWTEFLSSWQISSSTYPSFLPACATLPVKWEEKVTALMHRVAEDTSPKATVTPGNKSHAGFSSRRKWEGFWNWKHTKSIFGSSFDSSF